MKNILLKNLKLLFILVEFITLLFLQNAYSMTAHKIYFKLDEPSCSTYVNDVYTDKIQFQTNKGQAYFKFNSQFSRGIFDNGAALRLSLFEFGGSKVELASIKSEEMFSDNNNILLGILTRADQKDHQGRIFSIKKDHEGNIGLYDNAKLISVFKIGSLSCKSLNGTSSLQHDLILSCSCAGM